MTELDPDVRAAIARSRASRGPPAGAEQRMLADFHARLGGPPGGGEAGGGGASEAAGGPLGGGQAVYAIKIALAVASLTAAGLVGVWLTGKAVVRAIDARAQSDAVSSAASVSTSASAGADEQAEAAPARPEPERSAAPSAVSRSSAPARERPAVTAPSPSRTPTRSPRPVDEDDLAAELKLIQAAREAPAAKALDLLERHAEQFPDGTLGHERESLRIIALCELGRRDEAGRAAERFAAAGPGALLIERVRARCGDAISLPTTDP